LQDSSVHDWETTSHNLSTLFKNEIPVKKIDKKSELSKVLEIINDACEIYPERFDSHLKMEDKDFQKLVLDKVMKGMKGYINPKVASMLIEMEIGTLC